MRIEKKIKCSATFYFIEKKMSTWNVGNYHWEEHNCNAWAKKRLQEIGEAVKVDGWEFSDITFTGIEANRTIRKNREIRSFEFSFECKFKHNGMEGKIKFLDVSDDAIDSIDDWEYELTFTGDSQKKTAAEKKPIRQDAEKDVAPVFRKAFDSFAHEFKELPSELHQN